MKSRILLTIIALATITSGVNAMDKLYSDYYLRDKETLTALLKECVEHDTKHHSDKSKVLPIKNNLLNEDILFWSDGRFILCTIYDQDKREIEVFYENAYFPTKTILEPHFLKVVGNKVKMTDKPNLNVTVEKIGDHTMLVYRDSKGTPIYAFYSYTQEEIRNGLWVLPFHTILAGNYSLKDERNFVFGERFDFYTGNKYDTDPGLCAYFIDPEDNSIEIMYGNGRVSRGDPSSPKYDKMPGGGGAGALMGPMVWKLNFTINGLDAQIIKDEPFVDHDPALDKGVNVLSKVQGPWQGVDGKWPFASMMPLTNELLQVFPADVLELMRAEIYARHGDTFISADNQNYFNSQPWYKKSNNPVRLTDVERFNVALIKQVISSKK